MSGILRAWFAGALVLLCAAVEIAQAQPNVVSPHPRRVLLLHSFGPHFAPWAPVASRFREDINKQSPYPIDLYEASLQSDRFTLSHHQAPFIDYLHALFAGRNLELVVALGAPAARFFLSNRPKIFPSAPMLVMGADIRTFDDLPVGGNETSIGITFDQAIQIDNILRLLPDTTTIAVALGDSPIERFWVEELRKSYERFMPKVTFDWLNKLPVDDMVKRVAALPPKSAVYYATVRVDANGVPQEDDRVLAKLRAASPVPIFSYIDSSFGHGIVGGPMFSTQEISRRSAAVAVRILAGENPGSIREPPVGMSKPTYDWRELRRWNISEARLPPDHVVAFREPTPWETYRWQILATLMVVLVQAAMIFWLLFERHRRQRAEIDARERLVEVIHLNRSAEVGALSSSFAHELSQPLSSIGLNADAAAMILRADQPSAGQLREVIADIRDANQHASEIMLHMRKLLKRAKQADLQDVNLSEVIGEAIHILTPEARKRNVTLRAHGFEDAMLVRADRIYLQQVILNLATNGMDAVADAAPDARNVVIEVARNSDEQVEVSVVDSGIGIPSSKVREIFEAFYTTKSHGTGLGLSIARTIVESFGGKIWAENRATGGAVLRFTLPLAQRA